MYVFLFEEKDISVVSITCSDAKAALSKTEIFPFGWLVLFKIASLCAPWKPKASIFTGSMNEG